MADERMEEAEEGDGRAQKSSTENSVSELGPPLSKCRKVTASHGPSSSSIKERQTEEGVSTVCQGNSREVSTQACKQGQIKQEGRLAIASPPTVSIPSSPFITPGSSPIRLSQPRFSQPPAGPATWLQEVVIPLSPEPDSSLLNFFRACEGGDITADAVTRADVILGAVLSRCAEQHRRPAGNPGEEKAWIDLRKTEAVKLYYRVLTSMCRAESELLRSSKLTTLLKNERFQRCMLVCGAELVLACHNVYGPLLFPETLAATGVTAFDVGKVVESFVRHEDTLPSELKRHLNSCDERILESFAWERGSSLYSTLAVARKNIFPDIQRSDLMPGPLPTVEEIARTFAQKTAQTTVFDSTPGCSITGESPCTPPAHLLTSPIRTNAMISGGGESHSSLFFRSPMKDRPFPSTNFMSPAKREPSVHPHLHSVFARVGWEHSPQRPSPSGGGETCAEMQLNIFFRKVLKLAAIRIRSLSERLQQPNTLAEQVYRVVAHALQQETSLFFNRHLDQIILCSIYGVCKVGHTSVAFKDIIDQYRKQPHCRTQVFRNVLINRQPGSATVTGDIIRFYNEVFVPASKGFLLQLGSAASPSPSRVPPDSGADLGGISFSALPRMSPQKVSASHNVYVSPMCSGTAVALLSPRTRQLCTSLGDRNTPFQSPGKSLAAINSRIIASRRLGRIEFTDAGNDEAGIGQPELTATSVDPPLSYSQGSPPGGSFSSPLKRPRLDR